MEAAIVGGSLTGLMYGIILRDCGFNVHIFERNPETLLAQAGAGLQVCDDVERLLHEYGCDAMPYWIPNPKADVYDKDGKILTTLTPGVKATRWDTLYLRLRRRFEGLEPMHPDHSFKDLSGRGTYLHDHQVEDIEPTKEKIRLQVKTQDQVETHYFDLAIVADGSGSRMREKLLGRTTTSRDYAGYLALRGTVAAEDLTDAMRQGVDRHCQIQESFFLSYTIPGLHGSVEPSDRVRNWVWYRRMAMQSDEYRKLTTTVKGQGNRFSLSRGEMEPVVWEEQKLLSKSLLEPHCAEHLQKTDQPFVQVITTLQAERAVFHKGKVLLVGDASATLRPLSGQGTNQGARGALALRRVLKGEMALDQWEILCVDSAEKAQQFGLAREQQAQLSD